MRKMQKLLAVVLCCLVGLGAFAQNGIIRGNVYDQDSGEPILFGNVFLTGTNLGATTDDQGFYTITNVPAGDYTLVATYVGYDSTSEAISLNSGQILLKNLFMSTSGIQLGTVDISAEKQKAKTEVQISTVTVTPRQIKSLPSAGGEPDIAQYLPVLPGVIFTGDQGGQLYIRGGSPVQNKILLDGMTIIQPFHSIGFFSVFETETIRTVDVLTGGFNAEHGGRISAVVDIKTREGNKKRLGGLLSASPFQAKALIEGPIVPLKEDGSSISFLVTAKQSLIERTSKTLYDYASDNEDGIPFGFRDLYGKISLVSDNGSKLNVFGFNFTDDVLFNGVADLNWNSVGGGLNFNVIPSGSNLVIDGIVSFSNYELELKEADDAPRTSGISGFNIGLNFTNYGTDSEFKYGLQLEGFRTDFRFRNFLGNTIEQFQNTTEISTYGKYRRKLNNLIIEPSLRVQYYASLSEFSVEPRLGIKYNIAPRVRFKLGAGYYSQNLISTTSDLDVVNLFQGFLSGPESSLTDPETGERSTTRLQKSRHAVAGFEIDLTPSLTLNVEPYYKEFTQLIALNRNKLSGAEPDFQAETGDAYGLDFLLKYDKAPYFFWATYSLGKVTRFDGEQTYPTVFDRRHNVNLLASVQFGSDRSWEAGARWNMGSGFPFTLTQGFYGRLNISEGSDLNYVQENPGLGILLDERRNAGRLPYYHRLDLSLKKTITFGQRNKLIATISATNAYNRENIFFFDRVRLERVDQLPILPSAGLTWEF